MRQVMMWVNNEEIRKMLQQVTSPKKGDFSVKNHGQFPVLALMELNQKSEFLTPETLFIFHSELSSTSTDSCSKDESKLK